MTKTYFIKSIISLIFLFSINYTTAQNTYIIGAGTMNSIYPFNTQETDSRTQIIYTASELHAAGSYGGAISKIAFNVSYISHHTMNGLTIKIQEVGQGALSSFINTGWTTIFSSNYALENLGWNSFTLTSPFHWNGISNLLIQICYDNDAQNFSTSVKSTIESNNKVWIAFQGYGSGCTLTNGFGLANRPNLKFTITPFSSNDMAAAQIVSPINGASANANMPISIKVTNNDSIANTGYTVKYSIDNGSSWKSQSINSPLGGYASNTVNFTGANAANMSTNGLYQCMGVVEHTGDTITYNDTIRKNITIHNGAYSGTFTIGTDNNDDFPDLATAIESLNIFGVNGAVNLKIKPNTYTGHIRIRAIIGVSQAYPLTIESYTGNANDVIFQYNAINSADNYIIRLDTAQNVIIKNITFKALGQGDFSSCIKIIRSSYCNIDNNKFISVNTNTTYSNSSIYMLGNNGACNSINISNNLFEKNGRSITILGTSTNYNIYNLIIDNNTFIDSRSVAISLYYINGYSFSNNNIRYYSSTVSSAILISQSSGIQRIEKNTFYSSNNTVGHSPFVFLTGISGSATYPIIMSNNYIYQGFQSSNAILFSGCGYLNFYNNSIYSRANSTTSVTSVRVHNPYHFNNLNNSIINMAGGKAISVSNTGHIYSSDYNNYYTTGSFLAQWGNNTVYGISSLRTISGKEANSINYSPTFVGSNDYLHSIGTSLNNKGFPLSSVSDDIDGEPRSTTTPDIGANEFTIYNNDAGILGFTNTINPCPGNNENINVELRDFGFINMANVNISWSVNGVAQADYTWTGSLAFLNSTTTTIGTYSFSTDSTYKLKAWVNSVNLLSDSNANNDTIRRIWLKAKLATGSYIIGNSNAADFSSIQSAIDTLNRNGICGPIIFNIEDGIYNEHYTIGNIAGTNSTNTVTFRPLHGDTANVKLINNTNTNAESYVLALENTSYINFKNLSFYTSNNQDSRALKISSNSSHILIDSCNFIGNNNNITGDSNILITAQNSNNITISNSNFRYGERAIHCYGDSSSSTISGINISNNTITNHMDIGISTNNTGDSLSIIGNIITGTADRGIKGIYIQASTKKTIISNNKILLSSNNAYYGIYAKKHNIISNSTVNKLEISNNFIYINSARNSNIYGIHLQFTIMTTIYYNTIKMVNNGSGQQGMALLFSNSPYTYLKNNSIDVANLFILGAFSNQIYYSNYNAFNTQRNQPFRINSSNKSFSSYKSYTGLDSLSLFGTIDYLNTDADLHLYDINLQSAGSPIAEITTDIDGETRDSIVPSIGADEYKLHPNDAQLYTINSPLALIPIGNTSVNVAIRNIGTSTLLMDSLHYNINNGPTTSIAWAGNLASLAIDSSITIGSQNLMAGEYTVKAWSSYPNDSTDLNKTNDTLTKSFLVQAMPVIMVTPTSISHTTTVCSDSIIIPLKIKNTGNVTLNYSIDSTLEENLAVVVLTHGVISPYYQNISSSLGQEFANFTTSYSSASTIASLQSDIANKDVIVIPSITSSNFISTYASFTSVFRTFVSNGGSIIFAGQSKTNYITNTGLWCNMTNLDSTSNSSYIIKQAHNITNDITSIEINDGGGYYNYSGTPLNYISLLSHTGGNNIAGYKPYGNGYIFVLAYHYRNTTNISQSKLISNTLKFIYNHSDKWINASPISGSIIAGDSTTVNLKLNSKGLAQGVYTNTLRIHSNYSISPIVNIPCTLTVNGNPKVSSQSSSISFGTQYIDSTNFDSLLLYNTGCSDLYITNISNSNSAYTIVASGDTILAGNYTWLKYKFTSAVAGTYNDSAIITSNASDYTIYLTGETRVPTLISITPDPINISITNCNDSLITNLQIQNTGEDTLNATFTHINDSTRIIILTYGSSSQNNNNLISALGTNYSDYSYISLNSVDSTIVKNTINSYNANVIIIPYISSASTSSYANLANTLQNFANAGGIVIITCGYYDNIFTATGLISASKVAISSNKTITVVDTNNVLTDNFPSTINCGNEFFVYYTFNETGITSLLKYNGYDLAVSKNYGNGKVIVLGYYYYQIPSGNTHNRQILSNAIKSAKSNVGWLEYSNTTTNLISGAIGTKSLKFRSAGLATGTYTTKIRITSNAINTPNIFVPCTLNVLNQVTNTVNLGNDTISCSPITISANGVYSSYLWSTGDNTPVTNIDTSGTYILTVDNGDCAASDTIDVLIHQDTSLSIIGLADSLCSNASLITIAGYPANGIFAGTGISGNTFSPTMAGQGTHNITYNYSYPGSGCTNSLIQQITIKPSPTASISGLNSSYCQGDISDSLIGIPYGGYFTGLGITDSIFHPSIAGAGNHIITYSYSNTQGCSTTATDTAHVLAPTTISFMNMQSSYCENDNAFSVAVSPFGGVLSGAELVGNLFTPSISGTGSFPIYYSYTDAYNCSNNDSFNIIVLPTPTATINSITSSMCPSSPAISLSGTPLGGVFSGNGVSDTSFIPSQAGVGTHYIKYRHISSNGCSDIDSTTATVNQIHDVNAGNDVNISYNNTTQLNGSISGGAGPFTYSWTPTNKVVNASQLSSSSTYITISTAFILSVIDNSNSCVNNDQVIVTITGGSLAGNIQANPINICQDENTQIMALGSGGASSNYSYAWTCNTSTFTSSTYNPTVSPLVNTTYSCTIGDGTDTIIKHITINVHPSPDVSINNLNSIYCNEDLAVQISATPPGGILTGGGIIDSSFDPTIAPIGQNTIIYSLLAANGCYGADTIEVLVGTIPSAFAGNDTVLMCTNNGMNIGQQAVSGVNYHWLPTTGLSNANIANPASTINMSMDYTLTASDNISGCHNSDNISIHITGAPTTVASNDTTICINTSATLSASGGTTYYWSNGTAGNTITVNPHISTMYYVIASAGACSDLDTVWVYVNNPKPSLGADTSICANQSITLDAGPNNTMYQWSTGANSQTITIDSLGIGFASIAIDAAVVDDLGCNGKDTIIITFVNCTGLNDIDNNDLIISIYPNPTEGLFSINSNKTKLKNLKLEIIDFNGRTVLKKELQNNGGVISEQIDISDKAKGVYIIRLLNGNLVKTFKVLVQ